jgi:hypothetical protein
MVFHVRSEMPLSKAGLIDGKKRRERKTPMDFDNLEIIMGSIAHTSCMARREGEKHVQWILIIQKLSREGIETLAKC